MSMEDNTTTMDRVMAGRIRTAVEDLNHLVREARDNGLSVELDLFEMNTVLGRSQRVTFKVSRPIDFSRDSF